MTRSPRRLAAVGAIAALTLSAALTACGSTPKAAPPVTDPTETSSAPTCVPGLSLATLGPRTGAAADLGNDIVLGVNTAISEYNSTHEDCPVGLKPFDSEGNQTQAVDLAPTIAADDTIVGLIGPAEADESLSSGQTLFEAGLPSISPSATNIEATAQGWTTWHRDIANDNAQGAAAARYFTDTLGDTHVYVLDDTSDYGVTLADDVRAVLGDAMVGTAETAGDGQQLTFWATVSAIVKSGADGVFYGGYYTNAARILKELRAAGYTGSFGAGDLARDPGFVKIAGAAAAEGTFFTSPVAPDSAAFLALVAKYNSHTTPGPYSAEAYDAAKVFLDGIAAGATTRAKMMLFVTDYDQPGVTKQIKFNGRGEVDPQVVYAYVVTAGKITGGEPITQQ